MDTQTFSDDLRRYLALIWHWAWLLILAAVLAGGVAFFVSSRTTPVYQASTTLLVNEAPANKATDYAAVLTSERLARTYSELLTKNPVLEQVADRLNLDIGVNSLRNSITVELVRDTQLIELRVENTDPQTAADIANTVFLVFAEENRRLQSDRFDASKTNLEGQLIRMDDQIQETIQQLAVLPDSAESKSERDRLETVLTQYRQTYAFLLQSFEQVRIAEAQSSNNVVQVEPATAPPASAPVRPRTVVNTVLAAAIGFVLALGVILLIEALDDTLSPVDVARQLGLPVLGLIATHTSDEGKPVTMTQPRAPVAEAFRSLRTNIQFASVDKQIKTLLVTSPSPEDGKSTVSANLAIILAQSGKKVALIDSDLRRPQVHRKLSLPNRLGMSSLFVQQTPVINGALQETNVANLFAVTSGDLPPNPAELLGSERMTEILDNLTKEVDIVVVDTPPVMAVTDAAVLAQRIGGVLLVVKPGATKLAAARQAIEQLRRVNANILGVVLNDVDINRSRYKYAYYKGYYYTYQKYYGADGKRTARANKK